MIPGTNPFRKKGGSSTAPTTSAASDTASTSLTQQNGSAAALSARTSTATAATSGAKAQPPPAPPRRSSATAQTQTQASAAPIGVQAPRKSSQQLEEDDMRALDALEEEQALADVTNGTGTPAQPQPGANGESATSKTIAPTGRHAESPARPPPPRSRSSTAGSAYGTRPAGMNDGLQMTPAPSTSLTPASTATAGKPPPPPPQSRAQRASSIVTTPQAQATTKVFDPADELADLQRQIDGMMHDR